ncbi:hypothetical protein R3P38DRAFT_3326957 [Favolaschia claudopus]|uniref:Uncharacterized protein n=1 Tax=Favolaschia claudopus TaxID=2862362 RepID=A0AAW0A6Z5_9AGAR
MPESLVDALFEKEVGYEAQAPAHDSDSEPEGEEEDVQVEKPADEEGQEGMQEQEQVAEEVVQPSPDLPQPKEGQHPTHGRFLIHPECCARVEGQRQTCSVHVSSPRDPNFVSLPLLQPPPPVPKPGDPPPVISHFCASCGRKYEGEEADTVTPPSSRGTDLTDFDCTKIYSPQPQDMPAAEFINSLDITGAISAKARGKELLVAICNNETRTNFAFRVHFGMQGHLFWMPTKMYLDIVSEPPVPRGEKSFAFRIPAKHIDGPVKTGQLISIQAAFIRPKWTLVFVDHNVMIQFHLMRLSDDFQPADLNPKSTIWSSLWSATHGPVFGQEPEAALAALRSWRATFLATGSSTTSILQAMKTYQKAFNGSGAQESNDQLFMALIHPQMPAKLVCTSDILFDRLVKVLCEFDVKRVELTLPGRLPYASSNRPFYMNESGQEKYLRHVLVFRRKHVRITAEQLREAHGMNLFQPRAIIQADGRAILPKGVQPDALSAPASLRSDRNRVQASTKVANRRIVMGKLKGYTPFTAQPAKGWCSASSELVTVDMAHDVNDTTIGLYSFRIFVDCAWTTTKLKAGEGFQSDQWRRAATVGRSKRKRPSATTIADHDKARKKQKQQASELKENIEPVDLGTGVMTRAQRRQAATNIAT